MRGIWMSVVRGVAIGSGMLCVTLAVAYAAAPYVTLFRIGHAIRQGDATYLAAKIDWDEVREGLKEDICDAIAGEPMGSQHTGDSVTVSNELPPFGASFVNAMAANMVDANVTPERLPELLLSVDSLSEHDSWGKSSGALEWAFFSGTREFDARLRVPGQAPGESPIEIHMSLLRDGWKVTRASLPPSLLSRTQSRT